MRNKSFLAILLLLPLLTAIHSWAQVTAQVDEKEKREQEIEKRKELEHKTLGLLDEVISGAWGLKLRENRAFVLTRAADLLWIYDEKRARNLFWEALNNVVPPIAPAATDTTTKTDKDSAANESKDEKAQREKYLATYAARREFLLRVARHDPQLALEMMQSTRLPRPPSLDAAFPGETAMEQEIASEAAARDPKRALQIARESLAKGLSYQLLNLLNQINQKDQDTATEFAGEIINKLHTTNLATSAESWWVACSLLLDSRPAEGARLEVQTGTASRRQLKLSDDQRRDLVEMITDAALSASAQPQLAAEAFFIMPDVEQFAPDRAAAMRTKIDGNPQNRLQQEWKTANALFRNATPEEMIKAAAGMSADRRESLYHTAVSQAAWDGKSDALREYINTQITDEERKKNLLDELDQAQIDADSYHNNPEDLEKLIPTIRLKEHRVRAMAWLAIMLERKDRHDEAVKLIDEAQPLVKVDLKSDQQSNALLQFLVACALVEPNKAFAIIEPIIDRTNDEISKLALLDKIAKSGTIKSGEIVLDHPSLQLDLEILKYAPGAVALGKADFNRTKSLADRFQRNELRIAARLTLVQSLLRDGDQLKAVAQN